MALHRSFIIIALISTIVPAITQAKEFIVGDETGWTISFDYQAWAEGKDFRVGDKLVFRYPAGAHNVLRVNASGFQNCIVPPQIEALTSGNDEIVLSTPGRKWYICGVSKHCEIGGQKLVITVQPEEETPISIAPSPPQVLSYYESKSERETIYQVSFGMFTAFLTMLIMGY